MFDSKANAGLKSKELTKVNDGFQTKCNADSGHYGQTLLNLIYLAVNNLKTLSLSLLTFAVLLISPPLKSQDLEWFQPGHEWYYNTYCMAGGTCGYKHYAVQGDTTVAGRTGTVLDVNILEETGEFHADILIVQAGPDTVFRYSPEADKWHMLYDMGAEVGDVWTIQEDEFLGFGENSENPDLFKVQVTEVVVEMIGGEMRRKVGAEAWSDGFEMSMYGFGFIAEGIGPVGVAHGMTGSPVDVLLPLQVPGFQCFLAGGALVYGSPEAPCAVLSTRDRAERQPMRLHPNPVRDRLFFDLTHADAEIVSARITDLSGRTVLSDQISGKIGIDVGPLPPGIYVLEVTARDNLRASEKFVKLR